MALIKIICWVLSRTVAVILAMITGCWICIECKGGSVKKGGLGALMGNAEPPSGVKVNGPF